MNDLERELLQTLKNFMKQYEEDKRQQAALIENLMRQQEESGKKRNESFDKLLKSVNSLTERVRELERAYKDIANVLEE